MYPRVPIDVVWCVREKYIHGPRARKMKGDKVGCFSIATDRRGKVGSGSIVAGVSRRLIQGSRD